MNEKNSDSVPAMPTGLHNTIKKLDDLLSQDEDLEAKIADLLATYISDELWPGNIRELDRTLDMLKPGLQPPTLSAIVKNCLINAMAIFEEHPQLLSSNLREFLQRIQDKYGHKYRTGVYTTLLVTDAQQWHNVNVHNFTKNDQQFYGITIFRNDGETVYFEGSDRSLAKLVSVIQGVMNQTGNTKLDSEPKEA